MILKVKPLLVLENSVMEQALLTEALRSHPEFQLTYRRSLALGWPMLETGHGWHMIIVDGILDDATLYTDEDEFRQFCEAARKFCPVLLWLSVPPVHPIEWAPVLMKDAADYESRELLKILLALP